jgi:hypothetical protein
MRMGDLSKRFRLQADISSCKSIVFSESKIMSPQLWKLSYRSNLSGRVRDNTAR